MDIVGLFEGILNIKAETVTAAAAVVGLVGVTVEYLRQKRQSRIANPDELAQSVETNISPKTATDPVRLLYRHSFVSLFNHLERIEDLRSIGAVTVADLKPIVWLAKQLNDWEYHSGSISPFRGALEEWYERGKLIKLIDALRQ